MALAIKAPIVNLILAPFNLQLCTPGAGGAAPTAFPRSFSSRSLKDAVTAFGYDVSEDKIEILTGFFNNAMESFLPSSSTSDYSKEPPIDTPAGHFTQMVWSGSRAIGV